MDSFVSSFVENILCSLTALLLQGEAQFRTLNLFLCWGLKCLKPFLIDRGLLIRWL